MASLLLPQETARDHGSVSRERNVDREWTAALVRVLGTTSHGVLQGLAAKVGRKGDLVSKLKSGKSAAVKIVLAVAREVELPPPRFMFADYQYRLLAAMEKLRRAARLRFQTTPAPDRLRFAETDSVLARADERVLAVVSELEDKIERVIRDLENQQGDGDGSAKPRPQPAARR